MHMKEKVKRVRKCWVGKIPLRRAWQPTAVFLPGESPWKEEPGGLPKELLSDSSWGLSLVSPPGALLEEVDYVKCSAKVKDLSCHGPRAVLAGQEY